MWARLGKTVCFPMGRDQTSMPWPTLDLDHNLGRKSSAVTPFWLAVVKAAVIFFLDLKLHTPSTQESTTCCLWPRIVAWKWEVGIGDRWTP